MTEFFRAILPTTTDGWAIAVVGIGAVLLCAGGIRLSTADPVPRRVILQGTALAAVGALVLAAGLGFRLISFYSADAPGEREENPAAPTFTTRVYPGDMIRTPWTPAEPDSTEDTGE